MLNKPMVCLEILAQNQQCTVSPVPTWIKSWWNTTWEFIFAKIRLFSPRDRTHCNQCFLRIYENIFMTHPVRDISGYKLYFYDISGFKPHMYTCAWCESDGIHNFHHWGFRAELWILFGEKEIDFLPETPKERNSLLWYSAAMNYKLDSDILAIDSQKKTGKISFISYNSTIIFSLSREYPDQVYDFSRANITCNRAYCV